jgi:hypothetical protein
MTTARSLLRQLRALRAAYEARHRPSDLVVEIIGGLPEPSRWATVGGWFFEAEREECKLEFIVRVQQEAADQTIVFGGLPPLPGTEMIPPHRPSPTNTTWWPETDELASTPQSEPDPPAE